MKRTILALALVALVPAVAAADRGVLGVHIAAGVDGGAIIADVVPGSAADRAGLRGGLILTHIDGVPVADPRVAVETIGSHPPGDRLTLTVVDPRRGEPRRVVVTLAGGPAPSPRSGGPGGPGGPVPLQTLRGGQCEATAPPGWQVVDLTKESSGITVASADGAMRASWGMMGVGSGQAGGWYGPQYRSPAALVDWLIGAIYGAAADARPGPSLGHGFETKVWRAGGYTGYAIFRRLPLPTDPGGYIVSFRIGGATSEAQAALATSVAASIRCQIALRPPPPNDFHPSKGPRCFGSECSEADAASRSYNSILGTEYVHDAAGNNFYVGQENWVENGPDGPGYYKRVGQSQVKLTPGLQ